MARRQVSIFINGRAIANQIKPIRAEKRKVVRELNNMTVGTTAYEKKMRELDKLNPIINRHNQRIRGVASTWDKARVAGGRLLAFTGIAFTADAIVEYTKELFRTGVQIDTLSRKAETVLGPALEYVRRQAQENARDMGLTVAQYVAATTAIADLLIPMGFQRQEAAEMSTTLVDLSGALSEWTGGQRSAEEITKILGKAILGEREQLKELGISIQEADVKARLAEKGLDKLTGTMLQQAKAAATLELITEKSVDAQTSFATNTDSLVRKQQQLSATITDIKQKIARLLIPVFERLLDVATPFVDLIARYLDTPVAAKLKEEQQGLNVLVTRITEANIKQEDRNKLIAELQARYPDFLGQLDAETVTNEELASRLLEVNNQYIYKLALQKEAEKVEAQANRLADKQRMLAERRLEVQKNIVKINEDYKLGLDLTNKSLEERIQLTEQALRQSDAFRKEDGSSNEILARSLAGVLAKIELRKISSKEREVELEQDKLTSLQAYVEELKASLSLQLGIETSKETEAEIETQSINYQRAKLELLKQLASQGDELALKEIARREALAKELEKEEKRAEKAAEREIERQRKQLERLQEMTREKARELRVAALSEDEQRIEAIRQRYAKEIKLAKDLEAKGIREASLERLELERMRDEEIQAFREQLAGEAIERDLEREAEKQELELDQYLDYLEKKEAARQLIDGELRTEEEEELLQLELHYLNMLNLAEQFGFDTVAITEAYRKRKAEIEAKYDKQEIDQTRKLSDAKRELQMAQIGALRESSQALASLVGENTVLSKSLFLFEKSLAAAEVIINLQKEIAAISARNAAIPGGPILSAIEIAKAKARATGSLITIAATSVGGITQRKHGGWLNVTGQDDGITYRAQYLGRPRSGMLPNHPVVLASEVGREYFVSNRALEDPQVFNHVQAIDNIVRRRIPQYRQGGATVPLPAEDSNAAVTSSAAPNLSQLRSTVIELATQVSRLSEQLDQGIYAVIEDDTTIALIKRFRILNEAAGGTLD